MPKSQMQSMVEIYLQTNTSFIYQKLYSEFKIQCLRDYQLKDLDLQKMIKTMKVLFKFGQNNNEMTSFYSRLQKNIQKFIDDKYRLINQTEDMCISTDILMELVKFCVEKGFDQTPEEPIKEQIVQDNPQAEVEKKQPVKRIPKQKKQEPEEQKPKKFIVPKPKTPEKKNFIEKHQMPDRKKPARYLQNLAKKPQQVKQQPALVYIEPIDLSFLQKNRKLVNSRLQHLYQHYCSQQQNLGAHATFDRIQSECSHMTIGKFLLFCKISGVFGEKILSKQVLTNKFKRISDGKKQIDFETFKKIMGELDEQYVSIKKKQLQKLNPEGNKQVPTYEARLFLKNKQFKKMKKDIDLPFTTREREGRQLKQYSTLQSDRYTKKSQLTVHSGKFSKNLKEELKTKGLILQNLKKSKHKHRQSMSNKQKIIRLDSISQHYWPGMDWIIGQDDSDSTFMREYKLRDVVGDIKKRVNDVEKLEKSKLKNY